jgi:hypothetical protein
MARERVASSSFGQFMASTPGRITRGIVGLGLIAIAVSTDGVGAWAAGAIGGLLLAAGVFDFCVITGLIDNIWSGREVRARGGHRRAAPTG